MSPDMADLSLLELFALELATHRETIEQGLVRLESGPDAGLYESLMRAAHSIKGAARIVSLDQAVGLAHAMEDLFEAAREGKLAITPERVDALLAANDFYARLCAAPPAELPGLLDSAAREAVELENGLRASMAPDGSGTGAAQAQQAVEAHRQAASTPGVGEPHSLAAGTSPPIQSPSPAGSVGVTASPGAPPPAGPAHPPAAAVPETDEAVVRLSAETLGRFMGLAGQCVVETSALGRIFSRLRDSRRDFLDLAGTLSSLRATLADAEAKGRTESALVILKRLMEEHGHATRSLDALVRRMELTAGRLYGQALGTRMRPFGEGVKHLPRFVRDLARELGKNARLEIHGAKCRVDRDIMERLEAPLTHLVRNALDHGVESPDERLAAGKPAQGVIVLKARHVSGMLEVRLADDGRGVDTARLRAAVVQKGLAEPDMAGRLSDKELHEFLFLPGFSTSPGLTRVSGRGVGLDVVKTMLQEVGGEARVKSTPGQGMAFILRLPVSRSVIRALVFAVGGEPYALPLASVERVAAVPVAEVQSVEGHQYAVLDGVNVGLAAASRILDVTPGPCPPEEICVVALMGEAGRFGLAVESFLGERDLVVKPLDPRLGKAPCVAAASILEDGSPVLILDAPDLALSIERLLAGGRLGRVGGGKAREGRGPRKVLVADDSLTVREVERQLLSGRGYDVTCAVDGMEALALARSGEFDLIVTDVDMPRMTGIELTRAIKADPALAATPVMIVSYKDRPEDRLAGLNAGADHYLAKSGFSDKALIDAAIDLIGEP